MRSVLPVALSLVFLFQRHLPSQTGRSSGCRPSGLLIFWAAQQEEPVIPTAHYECDNTQCENPHSGGALWLPDGKEARGCGSIRRSSN